MSLKECCVLNKQNENFKYCPECGRYLKAWDNESIPVTVETRPNDALGNTVETHPSFGQVVIGRRTSNIVNTLYGSLTGTSNIIYLEISTSEKISDNYDERYFCRDRIIEVEMTPAQFSEMITSINNGSGTPVTISSLMGRHIARPEIDLIGTRIEQQVSITFKNYKTKISATFKRMEELLNQKSLKQSEIKELKILYSQLLQDINSNLPFLMSVINENVDKSVSQAKIEIDAFRTSIINQLGIAKLEELQALQIESKQL